MLFTSILRKRKATLAHTYIIWQYDKDFIFYSHQALTGVINQHCAMVESALLLSQEPLAFITAGHKLAV